MNKYQRKKSKYMKKLATVGVGYYQSKSILRKYSFKEIDQMIDQVNKLKKSGIFEKMVKALKEFADVTGKSLRKNLMSHGWYSATQKNRTYCLTQEEINKYLGPTMKNTLMDIIHRIERDRSLEKELTNETNGIK
ncbi:hypothetical protein [Clostridium sp. 001]|uniref:hypothetical protein n=1 Tax=Clostridium sp. 001 TaxID=1970093 RepID=UPI001C2BC473|nr:hypothetical protein [Clostridium sp. 001]QXE19521.1 hypothetical protein B5S50_12200 [Clostridium sp. 001]